jgi:hypothetical protein
VTEHRRSRSFAAGARRVLTVGGRALAALALTVSLAVSTGCHTADSVGGLTPSCIRFVPAKDPTSGEVTAREGAGSTCGTAEVELVVSGVDAIWSAEFEVRFPLGITRVFNDTGDSFLRDGTSTLLVQATEITPGLLEIGVSRVDSENNAGVTPTADDMVLIRLFFTDVLSNGDGPMTLEDANLTQVVNPGDIPTPFVPAIEFSGGEFVIEN